MSGPLVLGLCVLGGAAIVGINDAFHRLADRLSTRGEDWSDETDVLPSMGRALGDRDA